MTVPYIGFYQGIFSSSFLCYLWPQWLGRLLHFSKVPQYPRGSAKNRNLWKWEQNKTFHFRSGDKVLFIYILVKYYRFCSSRYTGVLSYATFEIRQSSIYYNGTMDRRNDRPAVRWSKVYFDRLGIIWWDSWVADLVLGHIKLLIRGWT